MFIMLLKLLLKFSWLSNASVTNSSRVYPVKGRKEHLCLTESLLLLKYTRLITDFIAIQFHDI